MSYCLPKLTAIKQGKDKKDKDRKTIRDRRSALGLIQGRLGTVFVVLTCGKDVSFPAVVYIWSMCLSTINMCYTSM